MEKAIKRAIEGGWKGDQKDYSTAIQYVDTLPYHCLLDPEFWQCLGKAEGWIERLDNIDVCTDCLDKYIPIGWRKKWHSLIDHLSSGGNIEDFFNKLLK
jgi:hypothetical protein